jgi:hypothetical protein
MRSTVEITGVVCPRCGEEFGEWRTPAQEGEGADVCPRCGFDLSSDSKLREEGIWALEADADEAVER